MLKVTGQFGWSKPPGAIIQATTILAERLFKIAREAPLGIVAAGEGGALYLGKADPGIMNLIGPYMRHRVGVG